MSGFDGERTGILFVCWGNICRSPAAAYLFASLAREKGMESRFIVDSAGVSDEEEGNGVYPPMRRELEKKGIDCSAHRARRLREGDYDAFDLLVCMDELTIARTRRFFGGDPKNKVKNLLDFTGQKGAEIADPWYTREFGQAMDQIETGCAALLDALAGEDVMTVDLSACRDREGIYAVLREKMDWKDWYGSNLDALWDVLTGLEHRGERFRLILPPEEGEIASYAKLVRETFREAGAQKKKEKTGL